MAEIIDLYDVDRQLTGKTAKRGDKLEDGIYRLVVHVCIFNSKGELISHGKEIADTYDDKNGKRDALEKRDGVQHLDGLQALMYGRLRSIDDDFHRTGRTRKLLSRLLTPTVEKIKNGELQIDRLLPECLRYFKSNMNIQTMLSVINVVMHSDLIRGMDLSDSLVEEFRIRSSS